MIERVLLDGEDVALLDVFASVTIRHGRGSADDGPLASTATLTLVNVTRAMVTAFSVADSLEVLLADDVPRFRGRITDASLAPLDDGGALSIIAVSSLSWLSNRPVGAVDWPEEPWSERLLRAFTEAGYLPTWSVYGSTSWADLDPSRTWASPLAEPTVTIEIGDLDPILAARPAQSVSLGSYLAELAATEPAAIANLPNGNVLVQALTARKAKPTIPLDSFAIAFAPEWSMVDDVENSVTVEYDGGEVTSTDLVSIERFEARATKITTKLATEAAAESRADLRVLRRAIPEWLVEQADLLELDPAIAIGSPVVLADLPVWAPADSYLGMVEGWEDHVEPDDDGEGLSWTMRLTLSNPRLSGFGLLWSGVPATETWADAGAVTWRNPDLILTS